MTKQRDHSPVVNPALWAMIVIPTAAVIASFVTLGLAMKGSDAELPKSYATEGQALDADLALGKTARQLGIQAALDLDTTGTIVARVRSASSEPLPARLSLTMTHVIDPDRDRKIDLIATDEAGTYTGRIDADLSGRWLLQLDQKAVWRLRGRASAPANGLRLGE